MLHAAPRGALPGAGAHSREEWLRQLVACLTAAEQVGAKAPARARAGPPGVLCALCMLWGDHAATLQQRNRMECNTSFAGWSSLRPVRATCDRKSASATLPLSCC